MKDDLARRLLATVTGVDDLSETSLLVAELQALAAVKYDGYEGYRPGVKFLESLAVWLEGFRPQDRATALTFVRKRLVYLSPREVDRLVATVYPDILRPFLVDAAAGALGLPHWRVAAVTSSKEFAARQRRVLLLGMSDGARLDRLRRSSELSTEQFHLVTQLDGDKAQGMAADLCKAMVKAGLPGDHTFSHVVLVDDFAASGKSMVRPDAKRPGKWKGKLIGAQDRLERLRDEGVVSKDATVTVLVYLVTAQADGHVTEALDDSGLADAGFAFRPAYVFGYDLPLRGDHDAAFVDLCRRHYREQWSNEHTRVGNGDFALGFDECALPVVLHHNTPNNSPPILWRDEMVDPPPGGTAPAPWVGAFPRHERHHPGRP